MGSIWTVTPESVRYELTWGEHTFWVDVKKELNAGEEKKLIAMGLRSWTQRGDEMELNTSFDAAVIGKVWLWVADWSLTDDKGQKLPRNFDTVKALNTEVFGIIERQVDEHAKAVEAKKAQTSGTTQASTPLARISAS